MIIFYSHGEVFNVAVVAAAAGQGQEVFGNKDVYVGNFVGNQMDGQGTMKYINGDVYTGNWVAGVREGEYM